MEMATIKPKVSVCVVTYNQEKYIRECLQSVVNQVTDFEFEIVIGDDCSTDGTTVIVEEFARLYPHQVRVLFSPTNLGPFENYRNVHRAARGEFVAHVDGDDSLLPGKLAKQASILEANSSAAAVFHRLQMVDAEGRTTGRHWPESAPEQFNLEYLVLHHPVVGHSSMMYRRGRLDALLTADYRFIDFRVYVELAIRGAMLVTSDVLGRYTVNVGISKSNRWLPEIMSAIEQARTNGLDAQVVECAKANHYFRAALNEFYVGAYSNFRELIETSVRIKSTSVTQRFFYYLRYLPGFLRSADFLYKIARGLRLIKDIKLSMK